MTLVYPVVGNGMRITDIGHRYAFYGAGVIDATQAAASLRMRPSASFVSQPDRRPAFTTAEQVEELRGGGLPISAIAEMARVERKTVYSWLDGTAPQDASVTRMRTIYELLTEGGWSDFRNLYRFWSTPFANGSTLKSVLTVQPLNIHVIRDALAFARPMAERAATREAKLSTPGSQGGNAVLDAIGDATVGP